MQSNDPINGQPFLFGSSTSGITDITTDATLLGKGTPEEPLKVTNPEKDLFLEVDNIEIDANPHLSSQVQRNGRHAEIDLSHFSINGYANFPTVYEEFINGGLTKRYHFVTKSTILRLQYSLRNITFKEIDKLIIGVELGKQFENHPTMQHIVANFQKRHHYHTFCDSLFLVQKDYKSTKRLHNILSFNEHNLGNNLTEKRYYKETENSYHLYEINNGDTVYGNVGYIMGTPYSATNFLGGVIGYDAFSATNYIENERAIFDSIFGIQQYIVQAMHIEGTGVSQNLVIELKYISNGHIEPSEIKKYVSGGIHIYLP